MGDRVRMVQFGLGPIGCRVVQYAVQRLALELVGAVDIDPQKAGRDLGEVTGMNHSLGVPVSADAEALLRKLRPDVVVHTTGSKFDRVFDQLTTIVRCGANVVSTCEELSYPYRRHPRLSEDLDRLARSHEVTVLSTGINPGFLMDAWPLFMTGVCREVWQVQVTRIQDASPRRVPFQRKIGAGLTREEFRKRVDAGDFGHVGLPESISMIGDGLGWRIERIEETIEAVLADKTVRGGCVPVEMGQVAGLRQTARGFQDEKPLIVMEFQAYVGASESYDEVSISGEPSLKVRIHGGTQGDIGTVSMVLNAVPRVKAAPPGLMTMRDLPIAACAAAWGRVT